ncbi:MAG: DUF1820 family protein [Spirochaetaceae bacterium]|nr:MAG: DUF1820 family protein [Spirochaetaceae bacterium]
MSLYKVHFKWKDKEVTLRARGLDLTHPYFVSITGMVFPEGPRIIIDPGEDEVRRTFGKADHLMIPFQTVSLIEEYQDEQAEQPRGRKVRKFTLVDESSDQHAEDPEDDPG